MEATSDADGHFEFCIECDCNYQIMAEKMYFKNGSIDISTASDELDNCRNLDQIRTIVELEAGDLSQPNPNGNLQHGKTEKDQKVARSWS